MTMIEKAWNFAAIAHNKQLRYVWQNGVQYSRPYLLHLIQVYSLLDDAISNADYVIPYIDELLQIAILHDVLEDTNVTPYELKNEFSEYVATGVFCLTKDSTLPSEQKMESVIRKIKAVSAMPLGMIKLCDRISNSSKPPAHWHPDKIKSYWVESVNLGEVLCGDCNYLDKKFEKTVNDYYTNYVLGA